jgi:drug/metabolite transporter (DMT)-like permease
VFGDTFYFRALVILGPGRAALLASLAPLFTVAIGWPLLGEKPGPLALIGMALTIGGIFWVLWERQHTLHDHVEGSAMVGVMAGVLGALGQAVGYVISKLALRSGLDPLSATVIRVGAALVAIWLLAALQREVRHTARAMGDRRAALFMVGGAFFGPFLGVTLSLAALEHIQAGVAASITASYPLLTILIAARFHGEKLTVRYLGGAAMAVAGVVVLFLR